MKKVISLGMLFVFQSWTQTNRVKNFSFETADPTSELAQNWTPLWGGYERALSSSIGSWDGSFALKFSHMETPSNFSGAIQKIVLNQSSHIPVLITGRVKGTSISNISNDKYGVSLYCRVRYTSGETDYCPTTSKTKNVGTFDWRLIGINTGTLLRGYLPIEYIEIVPMLGLVSGAAWFDDIHAAEFQPGTFGGALTMILDDGFKEHTNYVMPKMAEYDWVGTLAAVSNYLSSGDPEYMNWSDLQSMKDGGWEIASHSVDHSDLVAIGITRAEDQFYWSKRRLSERGFNVKSFILPFGSYNAEVLGLNSERGYYSAVRKVERGYNPMGAFPYDIKIQELKSSTTFSDVTDWLSTARNRRAWLVILVHKVRSVCPDQFCVSPVLFDSTLSAMRGSALPVVTFEQGLTMVKSPH